MVDRKPKNQITGLVSASAAGSESESESDSLDSSNTSRPILSLLNAFYRFSRPHTIIGTVNLFNLLNFFYKIWTMYKIQISTGFTIVETR